MPLLWPFFQAALTFLIKEILLKFLVLTALMAVFALLMPMVFIKLMPFLGLDLSGAFSSVPATVWFFADAVQLGYGIPLMISAYVARFLIRRLPVVG